MWFIKHKAGLIDSGFFNGFADYHCHILPGVDDGVKTMEEALEALEYFEHLEVGRVILTPHAMNGLENREEVEQAFDALCKQYSGKIILELGTEYMLDSGFKERMEKELLCLDKDSVLVETSYLSPPNNLYELLYEISTTGNTPVIAHPERYLYMGHGDYYKLKEKDYMLQLNLLSLSGYYGKQVMKNADFLLEQGMYDKIGTDLHNLQNFRKWIEKLKVTNKQLEKLTNIR